MQCKDIKKDIDLGLFEQLMLGTQEETKIKIMLIDICNLARSMYKMKGDNARDFNKESKIVKIIYEFIKQYFVYEYQTIWLYFDGPKRDIDSIYNPAIQIEFSKNKTADDLIVNSVHGIVEYQPQVKKEIELITSDRGLISRCCQYCKNIKIIKSSEFINALGLSQNFNLFNI